jgi:Pyridoxamine 5'-phosphate oxidase
MAVTVVAPRKPEGRQARHRDSAAGWDETRRVLEEAELFWVSTVRADGWPHVALCRSKIGSAS